MSTTADDAADREYEGHREGKARAAAEQRLAAIERRLARIEGWIKLEGQPDEFRLAILNPKE